MIKSSLGLKKLFGRIIDATSDEHIFVRIGDGSSGTCTRIVGVIRTAIVVVCKYLTQTHSSYLLFDIFWLISRGHFSYSYQHIRTFGKFEMLKVKRKRYDLTECKNPYIHA